MSKCLKVVEAQPHSASRQRLELQRHCPVSCLHKTSALGLNPSIIPQNKRVYKDMFVTMLSWPPPTHWPTSRRLFNSLRSILVRPLLLGNHEVVSILWDGSDANPGSFLCNNRRASKCSMFTAASHLQDPSLKFRFLLGPSSIRLPPWP
jgi:hypothetical protein